MWIEYKSTFFNQMDGVFPDWELTRLWEIIAQEFTIENELFRLRKTEIGSETLGLHSIIARLKSNEPIDYIIGYKPFLDLDILVDKSVLIPRPETEEWVYDLIRSIKNKKSKIKILEIGTGSGCISLALKKHLPSAQILAIDISTEAISIAKKNQTLHGLDVDFLLIDFLDESTWGKLKGVYDIVLSNPPYIDRSEIKSMDNSVVDHEPEMALFPPGDDPLIFYRKINEFALSHLKEGGGVYLECNSLRSVQILALFTDHFVAHLEPDLQGQDRLLKAVLKE